MSSIVPVSQNVLVEVLGQFAHADKLPSSRALKKLADVSGVPIQSVKNVYPQAYQAAGSESAP